MTQLYRELSTPNILFEKGTWVLVVVRMPSIDTYRVDEEIKHQISLTGHQRLSKQQQSLLMKHSITNALTQGPEDDPVSKSMDIDSLKKKNYSDEHILCVKKV